MYNVISFTFQPMMNECLKKPCTGSGYLHLPGQALPNDHTGVFRYEVGSVLESFNCPKLIISIAVPKLKLLFSDSFSTKSKTSGIFNDATAYIGCSLNKASNKLNSTYAELLKVQNTNNFCFPSASIFRLLRIPMIHSYSSAVDVMVQLVEQQTTAIRIVKR